MRVVASDSWPIPSLITDIGTFLLLAMLAQECRLTYMVRGEVSPILFPIVLRLLFMLCDEYMYCFLSSVMLFGFIIGKR